MEFKKVTREWDTLKKDAMERAKNAAPLVKEGKIVDAKDTVALLEAVIKPYDKVNIEGNNQKQADFLAKCLCQVDPAKIHDLHMVQSVLTLPEHLDVFEKGIAKKLDMSFSGPQAGRIAQFLQEGKLELGAIHTYLELYGRYFVDLTPRVALVAATMADREGNLFTGFSTEDTPAIVEATKFRQGIVIAQVNKIVDKLPRVDIPGDWVDYVIQSPKPFYIEPLFTRDPALITDAQVLKGMMAIKGIYGEYEVASLNHGIGFDTAAIELLLPTYGEELGLKGKICKNFILNPHPTLIPAIETGWVESVHCFGGAPNMGCDPKGRRHSSGAWLKCGEEYALNKEMWGPVHRGKRLVVQLAETFREKLAPGFVEELDAFKLAKNANLSIEPVMIYGDDLTHIITEEGIAYLPKCRNMEERTAAIRGIAGFTEVGMKADPKETKRLRELGIIKTPQDLGIDMSRANRSMLAAKNVHDLVEWSGGLYNPPAKFRNW